MTAIGSILAFALTIALIVTVHEFGHYLAARFCGVRVLRFSVGFGKPIFRRQKSPESTEWIIAPILLGGYVQLLDREKARQEKMNEEDSLEAKSVGRRALIMAAGPAANFILAFVIYFMLSLPGEAGLKPVIGRVADNSPAASAGLVGGDEIASLNGIAVKTWREVYWRLLNQLTARESVTVSLADGGGSRVLGIGEMPLDSVENNLLEAAGIFPDDSFLLPELSAVAADSPAGHAGLKSGDAIVSINDAVIDHWHQLTMAVSANPGVTLQIGVFREGELLTLAAAPMAVTVGGEIIGRLGVSPTVDEERLKELRILVRRNPLETAGSAARKTADGVVITFRFLRFLVVGDLPLRTLAGPIGIAQQAGVAAERGIGTLLAFIALLSISVGAINLLPIPALDGGHLLLYAVEWVLGRPLPERLLRRVQGAGVLFVIALMSLVILNDIIRLWN